MTTDSPTWRTRSLPCIETHSAPETTSCRSDCLGWTWRCAGNPCGRPVTSYSSTSPPVSAAVRRNSMRIPSGGMSRTSPAFAIAAILRAGLRSEHLRPAGERVRRPVDPHGPSGLVADDAKELAAFRARDDAEAVVADRLEDRARLPVGRVASL